MSSYYYYQRFMFISSGIILKMKMFDLHPVDKSCTVCGLCDVAYSLSGSVKAGVSLRRDEIKKHILVITHQILITKNSS